MIPVYLSAQFYVCNLFEIYVDDSIIVSSTEYQFLPFTV